ncbi:MAG: zinc metallopeptidase, partial [Oscillospiraceae bacterium]
MRFLYMDYYYLVLVVPALLLALIAQFKVKSTFSAYSNIRSQRGLTGEQAARQVLSHYGINDVNIEMVNGKLT